MNGLASPAEVDLAGELREATLTGRTGVESQLRTAGSAAPEVHAAAVTLADPRPGLSWIDVGAGTGDVLRQVRDRWRPCSLTAVDVLPWLAPDLRADVDMRIGDAVEVLPSLSPADRVIAVETIEHLDAPWTFLRLAARAVKPGGRLVVTTPNVTNFRHRLELAVRGQLTTFRPADLQHLTPALVHVIESVLRQEGMADVGRAYATADVVPRTGGRRWPARLVSRSPQWFCTSLIVHASRPLSNSS